MDVRRTNLVLVGAVASGKTSLVAQLCDGRFVETHEPTIPYGRESEIVAYKREVDIFIWDTSGQEGYNQNDCPNVHIFLACFAISNRQSFEAIRDRFVVDMAAQKPGVPIYLVGTKRDMRDMVHPDDPSDPASMISYPEGLALAQEIGAVGYIECTAAPGVGDNSVREVFVKAVKVVVSRWRCAACCNVS